MEALKKNDDFREVYQSGCSVANRTLVLYRRQTGRPESRIGISVSKKIGNSVVRHRIKRLVKEWARLHAERFDSGSDYVVVARRGAASATYHDMEKALLHLLDGMEKKRAVNHD